MYVHFYGVKTKPFDSPEIAGVAYAMELARFGKLISAIKYIEAANPGISRGKAKTVVDSFGYNAEKRWPEVDRRLIRCL